MVVPVIQHINRVDIVPHAFRFQLRQYVYDGVISQLSYYIIGLDIDSPYWISSNFQVYWQLNSLDLTPPTSCVHHFYDVTVVPSLEARCFPFRHI